MKKALLILAIVVAIGAVVIYIFRDAVGFFMLQANLKPDTSFADTQPPPAPDYSNPAHWAALPNREDLADVTPAGVEDAQASAPVDVFFIHPTTYYTSESWNQPLDHAQANEFTDEQVLRNQASVFNSCCKIYAPRYRQATLYSFFEQEGDGPRAIEFAYADVRAAFQYFLDNYSDGRPFIIAGHSQGGKHADTLLREEIVGTPLQDRMVAAYPVGFYIDGEDSVPVCDHAAQTGCQVTWNTVGVGTEGFTDTSNSICVNPLHWRNDGSPGDFSDNLGAVSFNVGDTIEPGVVDGTCTNGQLEVSEVRSEHYASGMFGEGNYHIYDFNLYHMNVRENAQTRVNAFLRTYQDG